MPNTNHRKNLRLPNFDYAQNGAYSFTIVTQGRLCLFGEVVNGEMVLNEVGKMVEQVFVEIPERYPRILVDTFVVMPNHVHGLIMIDDSVGAGPRACPGCEGHPQGGAPTPCERRISLRKTIFFAKNGAYKNACEHPIIKRPP